jgi:hypothetical protein
MGSSTPLAVTVMLFFFNKRLHWQLQFPFPLQRHALALGGLLATSTPCLALATPPSQVSVIGELQCELRCASDPACAATQLAFDAADQMWQGTFTVLVATWRFKVALDGSAARRHGGPNNSDVVLPQPRPLRTR